jgi:hypothetical protein
MLEVSARESASGAMPLSLACAWEDRMIPELSTVGGPVMMVLTRSLESADAGRVNVLRATMEAVSNFRKIELFRVKSLLERRAYMRLGLRFVFGILLRGKERLPLQCILFDDEASTRALLRRIEELSPAVVCFDTVRCYTAIKQVRAAFPELRMVCDFDDLMSRRMRLTRELNRGFSLGYIGEFLPAWLRHRLEQGVIASLVLRYEAAALRSAEQKILHLVDGVVLLSSADAAVLLRDSSDDIAMRLMVAPPPFRVRKAIAEPMVFYRFIFIGQDKLLQNRLTIEWLLKVWKRNGISSRLHIYGRQRGSYAPVKNVFWEGFAADLADVYTPGSILLSPAFLAGGIKTKICEAISYGVIPLGNPTSFEGIGLDDNKLAQSEEQLIETIGSIETQAEQLVTHARRLQAYLLEEHGAERHQAKWAAVLIPQTAAVSWSGEAAAMVIGETGLLSPEQTSRAPS